MKKTVKKWICYIAMLMLAFFIFAYVKITTNDALNYKIQIPKTMHVATISNKQQSYYDNIKFEEQDVPSVSDNEVLVQVNYASFTQRDFNFFENNKNKSKFVPCSDFSGKIVAKGKNVRDYFLGDRVFGIVDLNKRNGACAKYVVVPKNNIYLIPYSLTDKQAAAIPTPALLNWFAVRGLQKEGVTSGNVLLDDALSETGEMLIALLSRNGFKVTGLDEDRVGEWILGAGADKFVAIEKFNEKKQSLKNSFDVVINLKHGLDVKELLPLIKKGGTFISMEPTTAKRSDIRIKIIDTDLIDNKIFAKMARLVHLGKLQIKIDKEFDLKQIRDAYIRSQKGNVNGKIVVRINDDSFLGKNK